ncbi:hypothetical protein BDW74DRAFT_3425 [Aspergillus multicolor]|uniref:uncharacterized protein n=1 Tax=Aspergillus multicolor TaxID=41759 RepID=UPI003CCCF387
MHQKRAYAVHYGRSERSCIVVSLFIHLLFFLLVNKDLMFDDIPMLILLGLVACEGTPELMPGRRSRSPVQTGIHFRTTSNSFSGQPNSVSPAHQTPKENEELHILRDQASKVLLARRRFRHLLSLFPLMHRHNLKITNYTYRANQKARPDLEPSKRD